MNSERQAAWTATFQETYSVIRSRGVGAKTAAKLAARTADKAVGLK